MRATDAFLVGLVILFFLTVFYFEDVWQWLYMTP